MRVFCDFSTKQNKLISEQMQSEKKKTHTHRQDFIYKNQSVENAGVAFVKEANERNEHFENINKQ